MAKNEYQHAIEKLNSTIDMFDNSYKFILNKIQDQDESCIKFMHYNLEKLSRYLEHFGKEFKSKSEDIVCTMSGVNAETDINIFI